MKSVVCTLFEGDYHFGVAALTNSLHAVGFRGTVYSGYRGTLPEWATEAVTQTVGKWNTAHTLDVADGLRLVFLSLETDCHLTNYKPDFMLELLQGPAKDVGAIFYCDPDICVVQSWTFFEQWITCGVALCEDVNSPLPEKHPRRVGWRRYFSAYGADLKFRSHEYVNGGFVGVSRNDAAFLELWRDLQLAMAEEIGGLSASKLVNGTAYRSKGFANCFDASDQDALNAAIEAFDGDISVIGQEAMNFKNGHAVVPHALGHGKPWQRSYLMDALKGRPPRFVDKQFWRFAAGPLQPYSRATIRLQRLKVTLAAAIGRAYRRR